MQRSIAALFVALVVSACPGPVAEDSGPNVLVSDPDNTLITDVDRGCDADEDCVLVDESCCPCSSNNGTRGRTAVNEDAVGAVDDRRAVVCADGGCSDAVSNNATCGASAGAGCVDGRCEVVGG